MVDGAERRDRVLDAVLREGDDVHVAFDDDHLAGVADGVSREIEAVELASLGEDRRFRRIEVLGLAAADHPAAEPDHAAAAVMDREHDAIPEAVVALVAVAGDDETRPLPARGPRIWQRLRARPCHASGAYPMPKRTAISPVRPRDLR